MTLDDNNACISFTVLVYSYQKRRVKLGIKNSFNKWKKKNSFFLRFENRGNDFMDKALMK